MEVVQVIRNYCKHLRALEIAHLEDKISVVGQESYEALIRQYGSQMKSARTDGLGHAHLVAVVNSCTNLEDTVRLENKASVDWLYIHDLEPRVADLIFDSNFCTEVRIREHWSSARICANCSCRAMLATMRRISPTR